MNAPKSHTKSTKAVDLFLNDLAFKLHNWNALLSCCSKMGVLKCFVVGALLTVLRFEWFLVLVDNGTRRRVAEQ